MTTTLSDALEIYFGPGARLIAGIEAGVALGNDCAFQLKDLATGRGHTLKIDILEIKLASSSEFPRLLCGHTYFCDSGCGVRAKVNFEAQYDPQERKGLLKFTDVVSASLI